ncbi:MAG: CotH kinase family protein [Lachnospiraceae bacterium]|nr:CotH kinase family protein [Lachnospiraceae bacterium]
MTYSKHIDKICAVVMVLAILLTVIFMNGEAFGMVADDSVSYDYEDTLFDDSYVHTINIEVEDWDSFLENATSEEYVAANVTIDGETVNNVGLRAKGNTSLSTVEQLDSDRYSLKIEFDCYESSGNYKGLDKLCLNNLIQDYTMMKDYVAYKLMNEFGVAAPLASYCYVTINGEDWGLYLAVEAVEDSFLMRNYGKTYGDLYKPDSMSMGGGRGNGRDFDMEDFDLEDSEEGENSENRRQGPGGSFGGFGGGRGLKSDDSSDMPDMNGSEMPSFGDGNMPNFGDGEMPSFEDGEMPSFGDGNMSAPGEGSGFGGGMGNSEVKLQYSDDDTDSYSTIFESAKTSVTEKDKKRLISSLKNLSEGIEESDSEKIESAVDIDAVLRYMVVHNFVVNGDSYTGTMVHNYYLYEEDGLLSMIPWDYNLAYGTFQGQDATSVVNDPIDTPLSVTGDSSDRPMFSWITSSEEYTEAYHEYFSEFIEQFYENGYMTELINSTYEMIREYVEKDPTKFCTLEEFDTAVEAMLKFVELRSESIKGQLEGTIPSRSSEQADKPDELIDASELNINDMGSMGAMGGGQGMPDSSGRQKMPDTPKDAPDA